MGWVAALAVALLATGGWAVAQDSGEGADSNAPAAQQSQQSPDQSRGPATQGQRRPFERPGRGRFRHRRDEGMRLDAPMLMAFRRLNLSDEQRERVRNVLLNARISALQAREKQPGEVAARQQFAALLNPGDPDHARAVQAAKDRAVDRIERATQTQQALYNVLTPAQKTQLTQMFAQRRERLQRRERAGASPEERG